MFSIISSKYVQSGSCHNIWPAFSLFSFTLFHLAYLAYSKMRLPVLLISLLLTVLIFGFSDGQDNASLPDSDTSFQTNDDSSTDTFTDTDSLTNISTDIPTDSPTDTSDIPISSAPSMSFPTSTTATDTISTATSSFFSTSTLPSTSSASITGMSESSTSNTIPTTSSSIGINSTPNETITGDTVCNGYFCLAIALHEEAGVAEFLITTESTSNPGWIGIGIGNSMPTSDLIVIWPDTEGTITISRRKPHNYDPPVALPNQTAIVALPITTKVMGASGLFTVHFQRPLSLAESNLTAAPTQLIWAYSSHSPSSASENATFTEHDDKNAWTFDLSKPIKNGTFAPLSASSTSNTYDYFVYAHGSIMFFAWGVSMPIATIISAFFRNLPNWVNIHRSIQFFSTALLSLIGLILGTILHGDRPENLHTHLGIPLVIALIVQTILGWVIHHLYDPARIRRPVRNWLHRVFGGLLLIAGFIQMPLGLAAFTVDGKPRYFFAAYAIVVAAIFIGLTIRKINQNRHRGRYGSLEDEHTKLAVFNTEGSEWNAEEEEEDGFSPVMKI